MDIKKQLTGRNNDETALILATISCYLPVIMSVAATAVLSAYVLFNRERRAKCTGGLANIIMYSFTALTIFTAYIYDNYLGIACSLFFFCAVIIMNFAAAVANKQFFIRLMQIITRMGVVLSFAAFTEKLVLAPTSPYRCMAYCINPNYLADLLVISVLACAYLEITKNSRAIYCYSVAAINCVAIFLTGSMFAWVSILVGLAIMLLLARRHIVLSVMFIFCVALILIAMSSPDIFPRLNEASATTENRFRIWKLSIRFIKEYPLFGEGFLTYRIVSRNVPGSYVGWHSHNIIIECLLSFGAVGTGLIFAFFGLTFRRLGKLHEGAADKHSASCFVIAMLVAALAHSMVDLTFMWTQTGLLGAIIIGAGIGANYRSVKKKSSDDRQTAKSPDSAPKVE